MLAKCGEPARVAMRRVGIGRQRAALNSDHPEQGVGGRAARLEAREDLVVVQGARAGAGAEERAGALLVAAVDEDPDRAGGEADARERVVELVEQQRRANAGVVHLVQLLVDLSLRARGTRTAAAE